LHPNGASPCCATAAALCAAKQTEGSTLEGEPFPRLLPYGEDPPSVSQLRPRSQSLLGDVLNRALSSQEAGHQLDAEIMFIPFHKLSADPIKRDNSTAVKAMQ